MFERVGRPLDPDWGMRQIVAIAIAIVAAQCAGVVAAAALLARWVLWMLWELVRRLAALWLGLSLPPADLLLTTEEPEPVEIREVALDGWEPLSDTWGEDPLPDRPLPPLPVPAPPPGCGACAVDVLRSSSILLKLIGTSSGEGAVADLWGDDSDISGIIGVLGSGGLDDPDGIGGLASAGIGVAGGTGGGGGGGTTEGLGGLGTIGTRGDLGTIDTSEDRILRTIRREPAFRRCYEEALARRPELGDGRVVLAFTASPDGSASEIRIASSTLGDDEVEQCLVRTLSSLRLPDPGTAVSLRQPFVFAAR